MQKSDRKIWKYQKKFVTLHRENQRNRSSPECDLNGEFHPEITTFLFYILTYLLVMVSINSNFALSRLNNPEFTALFVNVQKAINTATPENLGIGELYPAYNAKLQELIDRVYVSQGSEFTAAM